MIKTEKRYMQGRDGADRPCARTVLVLAEDVDSETQRVWNGKYWTIYERKYVLLSPEQVRKDIVREHREAEDVLVKQANAIRVRIDKIVAEDIKVLPCEEPTHAESDQALVMVIEDMIERMESDADLSTADMGKLRIMLEEVKDKIKRGDVGQEG